MGKFGSGSQFKYLKYTSIAFLLFAIIMMIIVEEINFVGFLIAISIYGIFILFELFYSYNGLMLEKERLVVCNVFTEQKFSILLEEIVKVDIVMIFRNSYIEIVTNDYDTRRFSLKGFSIDDLKSWVNQFQELEIDIEFIDKR